MHGLALALALALALTLTLTLQRPVATPPTRREAQNCEPQVDVVYLLSSMSELENSEMGGTENSFECQVEWANHLHKMIVGKFKAKGIGTDGIRAAHTQFDSFMGPSTITDPLTYGPLKDYEGAPSVRPLSYPTTAESYKRVGGPGNYAGSNKTSSSGAFLNDTQFLQQMRSDPYQGQDCCGADFNVNYKTTQDQHRGLQYHYNRNRNGQGLTSIKETRIDLGVAYARKLLAATHPDGGTRRRTFTNPCNNKEEVTVPSILISFSSFFSNMGYQGGNAAKDVSVHTCAAMPVHSVPISAHIRARIRVHATDAVVVIRRRRPFAWFPTRRNTTASTRRAAPFMLCCCWFRSPRNLIHSGFVTPR